MEKIKLKCRLKAYAKLTVIGGGGGKGSHFESTRVLIRNYDWGGDDGTIYRVENEDTRFLTEDSYVFVGPCSNIEYIEESGIGIDQNQNAENYATLGILGIEQFEGGIVLSRNPDSLEENLDCLVEIVYANN